MIADEDTSIEDGDEYQIRVMQGFKHS